MLLIIIFKILIITKTFSSKVYLEYTLLDIWKNITIPFFEGIPTFHSILCCAAKLEKQTNNNLGNSFHLNAFLGQTNVEKRGQQSGRQGQQHLMDACLRKTSFHRAKVGGEKGGGRGSKG